MIWRGLNWRRGLEGAEVVFLPVGSFEQHGPHLPYETDTVVAWEVARRLGGRLGVPVLPPLAYGVSPEHLGFPGTVSVDPLDYCRFLRGLLGSLALHGVRLVVVVNGHGGNVAILEACASHWSLEFRVPRVLHVFPWSLVDAGGDKHAGPAESSVVAYILGLEGVEGRGEDCPHVFTLMRVDECSKTGVVYPGRFRGDPELGRRLLEEMVEASLRVVCSAVRALGLGLECPG